VFAPRRSNANAEKAYLRAERIPEDWEGKPAKLPHKDRYAWAPEVHESEASGRREYTRNVSGHPVLQVKIPHFHRPEVSVHPEMGDDACCRQ